MKDEDIDNFVNWHKKSSEEEAKRDEEEQRKYKAEEEKKAAYDLKVRALWDGLVKYMKSTVEATNSKADDTVFKLETPTPDKMVLTYRARTVRLDFSASTHTVSINYGLLTPTTGNRALVVTTNTPEPLFAEKTDPRKPSYSVVTNDALFMSLLEVFKKAPY